MFEFKDHTRADHFVLLGDSITQQAYSQDPDDDGPRGSLGPQLSNAYMRKLDIIDRGFSGYNTRQMRSVMPSVIRPYEHRPKTLRFLVIFLGANDARLPNTGEPAQHVPLDAYIKNMRGFVKATQQCMSSTKIILITPPPIDEPKTLLAGVAKGWPETEVVLQRKATVTALYARAVCELGTELNVPVVDIWGAMMSRAGYSMEKPPEDEASFPGSREAPPNEVLRRFLSDGLHLSRKGYDLLYEELMAVVGRVWPDQLPQNLPMVWPAWDDPDAWLADGQWEKAVRTKRNSNVSWYCSRSFSCSL